MVGMKNARECFEAKCLRCNSSVPCSKATTIMKFSPFVVLLYLSQCNAQRNLPSAYPKIYEYQPRTDVRDHVRLLIAYVRLFSVVIPIDAFPHLALFCHRQAIIDKDVALIEKLLAADKIKEATKVYEFGAYSRNYAQLQFPVRGLPGTIEPHTTVEGLTESGDKITGTLIDIGNKGDKSVRVLYENDENLGACFVGGNPEPKFDGCKSAIWRSGIAPLLNSTCMH